MRVRLPLLSLLVSFSIPAFAQAPATPARPEVVPGFKDFAPQAKWDTAFMAVPDPKLAGEHLKALTAAPHWASSPEDYQTALYVADKFKAAGLATEIVPYRVWLNKPVKIEISAVDASGRKLMSGPTPEHVDPKAYGGDPFQDDKRVLPAFNGSSASGNVTADVVYANYGTEDDFKKLDALGVSVKGKIVIVRYGANFRGIKAELAQLHGAVGALIYSDPADDGYTRGDVYPRGPWRPANAVQRGSVQFLSTYPGDPQTPGVASTPDLPDSARLTDTAKMNQPSIPVNPLSYLDAEPILHTLDGLARPDGWQGGLPFSYHLGGTGAVKVHMNLVQDYQLRTIWDVIGTIEGTDAAEKDNWVLAGNHRDAWVYGAVDPNSGTAAMLETVHGLGELLKQGWKPKRTIVIGSWDAEEEGLVGSTEWVEAHAAQLAHAVAYFNTDVAVGGPNFKADAVPSLQAFLRQIAREVVSPQGGTLYDVWLKKQLADDPKMALPQPTIGALGSGSDFTPFLQHLGVPSTDMGSDGPYGVYHSVFDNYNWFVKFADPTFAYEQQQARVLGLEILHMADTDLLPYDYRLYGHDISGYIGTVESVAKSKGLKLNFEPAHEAARRFAFAGERIATLQYRGVALIPAAEFNQRLRQAETDLLSEEGLPHRPWYKHTIYAPGEFTGYAAVLIPGVTEAVDDGDAPRAAAQLEVLTAALKRAAATLEGAIKPTAAPAAKP